MAQRRGKSLLILGAGTMQLPALLGARRRGWRVAVASPHADEPGVRMADQHALCDLKDVDALVAAARSIQVAHGLDGVFTAGTDFSLSVASIADALGLPGVTPLVAERATDKGKMRAALAMHKVPVPAYAVTDAAAATAESELLRRVPLPLVVKPVDNMGSRGVVRVQSVDELAPAVEQAWRQSRSKRAMVEEYMDGPELSIDALVSGGVLTVCGVADRHIAFPPYFVEMGHTLPSLLPADLIADAVEVFRRGVAALGIRDGAAKGDIKVTSAGAKIGEIAARLSGGYMSGWTYPYASGVDLTGAALQVAVGDGPGSLTPKWNKVAAERAFVSIPGRVAGVDYAAEARNVGDVRDVFVRVTAGDDVDLPVSNVEKCGNAIACAADRSSAIAAAESAAQTVMVRLQPGDPRTDAFLYGSDRRPGAFSELEAPQGRWLLEQAAPPAADRLAVNRGRAEQRVDVIADPELLASRATDWHGRSFRDAVRHALAIGNGRLVATGTAVSGDRHVEPALASAALGARFWQAMLRGSVQGGVYALDGARRSRRGDAGARAA
jgi:biotin carboxylase